MRRRYPGLRDPYEFREETIAGTQATPCSVALCREAAGATDALILDRHDGSVWGLITPHSIDRTLAAERNAEVAAIPLVRAVGGAIGAVEEPHVDVLARKDSPST